VIVRFVDIDGIVDHHCLNFNKYLALKPLNNGLAKMSISDIQNQLL
jgi:hypothetical protein